MKSFRVDQKAILLAGLISVIAFALPVLSDILLPLTYLNTMLHEMCHAIAGQLSGASIDMISVNADGSGSTPMSGGSIWLIGPAGYIGASICGAAIIWYSRTEKGAQNTLRALAVAMSVGMLLWVRGDFVGVIAGLGWIATFGLASTYLKGMPILFAAQFVGLQQCLNSIQSIYTLMHVSAVSNTQSDALIMQNHTHLPAIFWAVGWCGLSLALIVISLRRAWSGSPARPSGSKG